MKNIWNNYSVKTRISSWKKRRPSLSVAYFLAFYSDISTSFICIELSKNVGINVYNIKKIKVCIVF